MRPALKVCGMRDADNIASVAALAPDYLGFIFYGRSPRYVGEMPSETLRKVPSSICKVGVFVDSAPEYIRETVDRYGLDMVQLHGGESLRLCREIRKMCPVIKAFRVRQAADLRSVVKYAGVCDFFLFDTPADGFGGSGRQFDWSVLSDFESPLPFFLSGGIGPGDADRIGLFGHPALAAVDVNSRFETAPGVKDVALLAEFIRKMNSK